MPNLHSASVPKATGWLGIRVSSFCPSAARTLHHPLACLCLPPLHATCPYPVVLTGSVWYSSASGPQQCLQSSMHTRRAWLILLPTRPQPRGQHYTLSSGCDLRDVMRACRCRIWPWAWLLPRPRAWLALSLHFRGPRGFCSKLSCLLVVQDIVRDRGCAARVAQLVNVHL